MSGRWLIRRARLLDPALGSEKAGDLFIEDGHVAPLPSRRPSGVEIFDAEGRPLVPALMDLHVHLREPGDEDAETIASGLRAARAAGFGGVVAMPNTRPPADTPDRVREILARAAAVRGGASLWPAACLTRGRAGGAVADLEALAEAGAVAFTDDGATPSDSAVMREAMRRAAALGRPVLDHAEDPALERAGVMHAGAAARRHGLPGIPAEAETSMVERDIALARETSVRLHIQHVSTAGGVESIRAARAEGWPVSAEATPHHLALTEADVRPDDANYKIHPPLRSVEDREALIQGVLEGAISCLATDHAPHTRAAKGQGFLTAPPGVVGLETAIGVTWTHLVVERGMAPIEWLRRWTAGPAEVLGRSPPSLQPGAPADLVLLDVETPWTVRPEEFLSKSRNTPFTGRALKGRALAVWMGGRLLRFRH
jgi:dihydroorotase